MADDRSPNDYSYLKEINWVKHKTFTSVTFVSVSDQKFYSLNIHFF